MFAPPMECEETGGTLPVAVGEIRVVRVRDRIDEGRAVVLELVWSPYDETDGAVELSPVAEVSVEAAEPKKVLLE